MAVSLPAIQRLNILSFSLGIRAEELNENFDLLRYWIESERLRTGGWGLVEGFDLSRTITMYNDVLRHKYWDAYIDVTEGLLINEDGKEVKVPAHRFAGLLPPVKKEVRQNRLTADATGKLLLQYPVYSSAYHRVVEYRSSQALVLLEPEELVITDSDTGTQLVLGVDIEYISGTEIKLKASLAHKEFDVEYAYADDRFDAIMVYKDGSSYMDPLPTGIISISPSQQNIQEYLQNGWYLIGFAYWHVGQTVDIEFITVDRTLRKVFVDRNNILYLNGKPYREKTVVYFEEPVPPTENDLWYNVDEEILYIWRRGKDGEYGWQIVNDLARNVTAVHTFAEFENPSDLQTFTFTEHPDLFFMPGEHQVSVIIDQVVVMEDQYEELYYSKEQVDQLLAQAGTRPEGEALYDRLRQHLCGYGVKLRYPLERPSIVEIRVSHNINTRKNDQDVFQYANALFLKTGSFRVANASAVLYRTDDSEGNGQYEAGGEQLEVYKNGLRLVPGTQYTEVLVDADHRIIDTDRLERNAFRLTMAPAAGDTLYYRILRPVTSYAHLKRIVQNYEDDLAACKNYVERTVGSWNQTRPSGEVLTISQAVTDHEARIQANETAIGTHTSQIGALQSGKMNSTAKMTKNNLDASVYTRLFNNKIDIEHLANVDAIFLNNVKPSDYIVVSYAHPDDDAPVLLSEARNDYHIITAEGGSNLRLANQWLEDAAAMVYITGIRFGV